MIYVILYTRLFNVKLKKLKIKKKKEPDIILYEILCTSTPSSNVFYFNICYNLDMLDHSNFAD